MIPLIRKLFGPKDNLAKIIEDGALIVDVRTRDEFRSGHIAGSRNIPLDTISKEIPALKKMDKPIVTVCRSGNRSGMAKSILISAGIEVYNGGAWNHLQKQIQ